VGDRLRQKGAAARLGPGLRSFTFDKKNNLMSKPMSHLHFSLMSFCFKIRDFFSPPEKLLKEAGIKPGSHVLDYGCGPGSYSLAAAHLVGTKGKVYALDLNLCAIESVRAKAAKKRFSNIEAIHSNCSTGLEDISVDVALLFDTCHELENPDEIMKELHRVMKPNAVLLFGDHHMKEQDILSEVTQSGLFGFQTKGKKIFTFRKKPDRPKA
jgi:ubiquinone/menaquinone biosynthesis C-methylase UbiE